MSAKRAAASTTTYDWYACLNFETHQPEYVGQATSVESLSQHQEFIDFCDEYTCGQDLIYLWAITADQDEKPHRFMRVKAVTAGYKVTEA